MRLSRSCAEVLAQPGVALELQRVGHLVQHDPEPQAVNRHPEPPRGRDYVPVEEEDLAWLIGRSRCEQRSRVVLSEHARREEPEQEPDLGRQGSAAQGPREVARARRGALHDGLHQVPEALDVEVDPLCPVGDPELPAARGALRELDPREPGEGIQGRPHGARVVEVARWYPLGAGGQRNGNSPGRAPGDHSRFPAK